MQVSTDKTVILLALSGQSSGPNVKPYLKKTKSGRCLKVHDGEQEVYLPIKQQHAYLGVVIGYQHFERATTRHRLHLSWQAFHRLHSFLCSKKLELGQRLRLWRACVLSIANYGLTAVGLDEVSASKLRSHVYTQRRIITGNPAHLTHESNTSLAQRFSIQDPVLEVYQRTLRRVEQSRQTLLHLQGTIVQQHWSQLLSELATCSENVKGEKGSLTEVTQVVRIQCSCATCGQQFGSFHALRTHVGKAHPEQSVALTKSSYSERSARRDEYIKHSVDGRPHCRHCQKQFSSWSAYVSHFNQRACPVLHMSSSEATSPAASSLAHGTPASETAAAEDDGTPIFYRSDTIALAKQGLVQPLSAHIRGLRKHSYCPECGVKCKTPMCVSRHATKTHATIKAANSDVIDWARNCQVPANPCTWCGESYSTQAKAHRNACPVLWACGHLLKLHSKLLPPGQTTLHDDHSSQRGGASQGDTGAERLRGFHSDNSQQPGLGRFNSGIHSGSIGQSSDSTQKRKEDQEDQAAVQQRTKWPKGPGKGQGYNQERKSKQQWWDNARNQSSSHSSDDLKNLVRAMGRLLIRREDSISILQQDTQLIVFLKNRDPAKPATEDWSIVQSLFLVGKH